MGAIDLLWHLLGLLLPAIGTGAIAASLAKWVWRRELAAVRWPRLARDCILACAAALVGGFLVFSRDGKMLSYAAMVAACALTLGWRAFGPRR